MGKFEIIYNHVTEKLENLPEWLTYHNANHTKYVLKQAEKIAMQENISGRDLMLVKIAALYHDIGFLVNREEHEKLGCQIASRELLNTELTQDEIEQVCGMINATRIPQKPMTILEKIVADADLEYLGTRNFDEFSMNLYKELLYSHPTLTYREWDEIQIDFLSNHTYHTNYCQNQKEPCKRKNLGMVQERLLTYGK